MIKKMLTVVTVGYCGEMILCLVDVFTKWLELVIISFIYPAT